MSRWLEWIWKIDGNALFLRNKSKIPVQMNSEICFITDGPDLSGNIDEIVADREWMWSRDIGAKPLIVPWPKTDCDETDRVIGSVRRYRPLVIRRLQD